MTKNEYGWYKCNNCSQHKRAWVESECYEKKLCPKCIDEIEELVDRVAAQMGREK